MSYLPMAIRVMYRHGQNFSLAGFDGKGAARRAPTKRNYFWQALDGKRELPIHLSVQQSRAWINGGDSIARSPSGDYHRGVFFIRPLIQPFDVGWFNMDAAVRG